MDAKTIRVGAGADGVACCERIRSLLAESPGAVVECDVGQLSGSVVQILDALARIRLVTRACGGRLTLHRADPALLAVIELFGLTDLFPTGDG